MMMLCVVCYLGESGQVYKGYLETPVGKELVAIKTAKGKNDIPMYSCFNSLCVFGSTFFKE